MASERITEELAMREMDFVLGTNPWGVVYAQSDASKTNGNLKEALERAGGKPRLCPLDNYECGGKGVGKPEFIITFDKARDTIIVVECKASVKKHESASHNQPDAFAVDGALYYAKFIKDYYNVIAIAVSGTNADNYKASAFDWRKGQPSPQKLSRGNDVLYSPENYLKMAKGEKVGRKVSVEDIQKLALVMHDSLRALKISERAKPVFIAGILIALKDEAFDAEYQNAARFDSLLNQLHSAIERVLSDSDIRPDKIKDIKSHFESIGRNTKIKEIPLGQDNSLLWFISELDKKIKPMMDHADNAIDALGIFYHEFVKYSGGDGSGLGIVLTPQHLTEFMCDLAEVNKNSKVVDICCGSGAFLVSAMSKMFMGANAKEIENIKKSALYGVESDDDIYTLAIANMIVRGDGKSNIRFGDCFNPEIIKWLKEKQANVGLINPPYAQKDMVELEFVQNLLDILTPGGVGVVVVPMSCAIGTKFKIERERLFKNHTLKAVFSMPDDIFYSNNASTNVCVMAWEAHKPHDSKKQTFFGYYKNDGFVKAKKLGRIDKFGRWEGIKKEWLELYQNLDVKDGLTAKKAVSWNDEWLCEAYMETDYSKLTQSDFEKTIRKYASYLVMNGLINLDKKNFERKKESLSDIGDWKKFRIDALFEVKGSKTTKLSDLEIEGFGDYPYITTQSTNNGVGGFFNYFTESGNILAADSAVAGFVSYQEKDFSASDHVEKMIPKFAVNKYIALFIATVINQNGYRYSYGRKFNQNKIRATEIKLPVDNLGDPDWKYMENYIKSLPYSDRI